MEHCGEVLGDSGKSEGGSSVGVTLVDLKVEVKCSLTDQSSLNSLARSPLLSMLHINQLLEMCTLELVQCAFNYC